MRYQCKYAICLWTFIFLIVFLIPILVLCFTVKGKVRGGIFALIVSLFVIVWLYASLQITSRSFMCYKRRCLSSMCIEFFKQKPKHLKIWADYGLLLGLKREKNILLGDTDLDLNCLESQREEIKSWLSDNLKSPLYFDAQKESVFHKFHPFKIDIEPGEKDDFSFAHNHSTLPLKGHPIPVPEDVHGRLVSLYKDYWIKRPFAKDDDPELKDKGRKLQSKLYKYLGIRF